MYKKILSNWKSGLTVSLVSIPLSIALAISTGATPTEGIITAFWAGLLGAFIGSSDFNIMGPTGALAGILTGYAITHGYAVLPIIAVISGILILLAYLFKLDKYIIFIPKSVIHGFTLGIAIIIGFGQLANALGIENLEKKENFIQNVFNVFQHINMANWNIFGIFTIGTIFILVWNKKFKKIPGAAVLSFISIFAMLILPKLGYTPNLTTIGDKYPDIHALLFENTFFNSQWQILKTSEFWMLAIATATIAILETLLSGQIAETLTKTKFSKSKEVLGLAFANIGSGLMGGIPATAALARTALNIKSGADHKTSAIINTIFLGIITFFLLAFFKLLPMVIIASILVFVAISMVKVEHFIHLIENEKIAFGISIIVAILVVIHDPIIGIMIGTIISLLIFVNKVSYGQTEVLIWKDNVMKEAMLKNDFLKQSVIDSDLIVYKISGTLTYINMPAHFKAIEKIKHNKHVIISLRHAFYADIDGVDYLKEIIETLKTNNDSVLLSGVNKEIKKLIKKEDFYKQKLIEKKIYKRTSEAINDITKK